MIILALERNLTVTTRSQRGRGRGREQGVVMNTYRFSVDQVIEVKANSLSEAEDSLPIYPTGFEGQAYYVTNESVELLGEVSV